MAYYYRQAEQALHPNAALHQVLQFIYRDLDLVLNDPTLKSREKMLKYKRLLNRLQFFLANPNNHTIPTFSPVKPPAVQPPSLLEGLLEQVPQRKRNITTKLFKRLQKSDLVKWNDDGSVSEIMGKKTEPTSRINIVALLNDAARLRKTASRPEGYTPFKQVLRAEDPTGSLIGNQLYKEVGADTVLRRIPPGRVRKRVPDSDEDDNDYEDDDYYEGDDTPFVGATSSSRFSRRKGNDDYDGDDFFQTPTSSKRTPATPRPDSFRTSTKSKKKKARSRLSSPWQGLGN